MTCKHSLVSHFGVCTSCKEYFPELDLHKKLAGPPVPEGTILADRTDGETVVVVPGDTAWPPYGLTLAEHALSLADGVKPGDWLASLSSAERKEVAVERGLMAYCPDALAAVARHSVRSNEKHNPGQPVHWDRSKSTDQGDCLARHHLAVAIDRSSLDDGQPHIICRAWRALMDLQLWIEEQHRLGRKI